MVLKPVPGFRSRRFVMRDYPGESQVSELADRLGWERLGELQAEPELMRPRRVMWQVCPGVVCNFMQNEELQVSYAVMMSEHHPEISHRMSQIIEGGLDVCTDGDLLDAVTSASGPGEKAKALVQAGIGAPGSPDNRFSRLFIDAVREDSREVREHGVLAIGYAEWAPFRELLNAISQQDSDARVRRLARLTMEAFDVAGIGDRE